MRHTTQRGTSSGQAQFIASISSPMLRGIYSLSTAHTLTRDQESVNAIARDVLIVIRAKTASFPMPSWLMKSEPDVFSIDDLERVQREPWTGVRNYQARNFMKDVMQVGELAIFYHSNAKPPGAHGVMRIDSAPYDDPTQHDPESQYYDPRSPIERPRWQLIEVCYVCHLPTPVSLQTMRDTPELATMRLLQKGNRLSILPLEDDELRCILKLGGLDEAKVEALIAAPAP
jgi:predicted RNA-binding protein with PUA-like domain